MSDHALRTLLAAIQNLPAGRVVSVDTFRDATDAAQIYSGAEKAGALTQAINMGYLRAPLVLMEGGMTIGSVQIRSRHEAGKGRWVMAYRRTAKKMPDHVCEMSEAS